MLTSKQAVYDHNATEGMDNQGEGRTQKHLIGGAGGETLSSWLSIWAKTSTNSASISLAFFIFTDFVFRCSPGLEEESWLMSVLLGQEGRFVGRIKCQWT